MSDEDNNILKTEDNIEIQKLLLEQKRLEQEKELKLKELEIERKQAARGQWTAPILVALIGGIIGLLSNFWSSYQNRALEREKQEGTLILEAIKTGQTKQAAANLIFLDNAKLIHLTEEQRKPLVDEAGKNPLPSLPKAGGIVFQPSVALTPELQNSLEASLNSFQKYLQNLGYQSSDSQISVEVQPEVQGYAYYDGAHNHMVLSQAAASDLDIVFREYAHYVLLSLIKEPFQDWGQAYRSIESGLADYLPCSFGGNPLVAETFSKQVLNKDYIRNLQNERKFSDLPANAPEQQFGEIWGGAFWEMRQQFGQAIADKLLFSAWANLQPTEIRNNSATNYVNKLLEMDRDIENGKHINEIRIIFERRGLKL
jgi:hypothetical protein